MKEILMGGKRKGRLRGKSLKENGLGQWLEQVKEIEEKGNVKAR